MGSRIITTRLNLNTTAGQGTFAVPLLGDPGEKRAYRLLSFGVSGAMTGASDVGLVVAIQDGEILSTLLSAVETGRAQRFVALNAMFDAELSVLWSLAMPATGGGLAYSSPQKTWSPGFMTANPLTLLFHAIQVGFKRVMVHVEYDQVSVSPREWTELRHRSTVVDLVGVVDT